jgi:hypothetical protein
MEDRCAVQKRNEDRSLNASSEGCRGLALSEARLATGTMACTIPRRRVVGSETLSAYIEKGKPGNHRHLDRHTAAGPGQTISQSHLFAATLLCARKLIELDSDRPSPAKAAAVENTISQAAFILECIDRKWPEWPR